MLVAGAPKICQLPKLQPHQVRDGPRYALRHRSLLLSRPRPERKVLPLPHGGSHSERETFAPGEPVRCESTRCFSPNRSTLSPGSYSVYIKGSMPGLDDFGSVSGLAFLGRCFLCLLWIHLARCFYTCLLRSLSPCLDTLGRLFYTCSSCLHLSPTCLVVTGMQMPTWSHAIGFVTWKLPLPLGNNRYTASLSFHQHIYCGHLVCTGTYCNISVFHQSFTWWMRCQIDSFEYITFSS